MKGITTKIGLLKVNKVTRVCDLIGLGIVSSSQQVQIMKIVILSLKFKVQMHKLVNVRFYLILGGVIMSSYL